MPVPSALDCDVEGEGPRHQHHAHVVNAALCGNLQAVLGGGRCAQTMQSPLWAEPRPRCTAAEQRRASGVRPLGPGCSHQCRGLGRAPRTGCAHRLVCTSSDCSSRFTTTSGWSPPTPEPGRCYVLAALQLEIAIRNPQSAPRARLVMQRHAQWCKTESLGFPGDKKSRTRTSGVRLVSAQTQHESMPLPPFEHL